MNRIFFALLPTLFLVVLGQTIRAQDPEPLGIALENFDYPWPVEFLEFTEQGEVVRMAYMDVAPKSEPNRRTMVLFHGKNFFGEYWEDTIRALAERGWRVIAPDQIGFGKSSKPDIHYSFHQMGYHTSNLLDHLGVRQVAVMGHSMGGMAATRFALMYPERVTHLVMENPIGLEDYRIKARWAPVDQMYRGTLNLSLESIRNQHEAYYVEWRPEYEKYIQVHYRWTLGGEYPRYAKSSALTAQMIYEQPVIHEFPHIRVPTLLLIGQEDRTAPFSGRAYPQYEGRMGYYPELGRRAASMIPGSTLVEFENVGHTPHFEAFDWFFKELVDFLE